MNDNLLLLPSQLSAKKFTILQYGNTSNFIINYFSFFLHVRFKFFSLICSVAVVCLCLPSVCMFLVLSCVFSCVCVESNIRYSMYKLSIKLKFLSF